MSIAQQIEQHFYQAFASNALIREEHASYVMMSIGEPILPLNIINIRDVSDFLPAQQAIDHFKKKNLPFLLFYRQTTPCPALHRWLTDQGIAWVEKNACIAASPSHFPLQLGPAAKINLTPVENMQQLSSWAQLSEVIFEVPAEATIRVIEQMPNIFESSCPTQLFVAGEDTQPQAITLIHYNEGMAGFYWGGVIPEARKRGIMQSMASALLEHTQAQGAALQLTHASPALTTLLVKAGATVFDYLQTYAYQPKIL